MYGNSNLQSNTISMHNYFELYGQLILETPPIGIVWTINFGDFLLIGIARTIDSEGVLLIGNVGTIVSGDGLLFGFIHAINLGDCPLVGIVRPFITETANKLELSEQLTSNTFNQ